MKFKNLLEYFLILSLMLSTVVPHADCCSSKFVFGKQKCDQKLQHTSSGPAVLSMGDLSSLDSSSLGTKKPRKSSNRSDSRNHNASNDDKLPKREQQKHHQMVSSRCPPPFDLSYCLNRGRCYSYQISDYSYPSCECSEGYFGERCESKYLEQSYYSISRKISVANICCAAFVAFILATSVAYFCHYRCDKKPKFRRRRAG